MSEAVIGVNKKKLVWTFCVFFVFHSFFLAMYFISFLKTEIYFIRLYLGSTVVSNTCRS